MISIVIPLYNKAHTIVHTLNAVFKQEYQDFEVIIVDDGSTDNGDKLTSSKCFTLSSLNSGFKSVESKTSPLVSLSSILLLASLI